MSRSPSPRRGDHALYLLTLTGVFVIAGACQQDKLEPTNSLRPRLAATIGTRLWPTKVRPEEQAFADLAAKSPSSAGFHFDSTGTMVVHVRDPAEDGAARGAAVALLASGQLRSAKSRPLAVSVMRAAYTFGELAVWRDVIFDNLLSVPGVTALDLDEEINRVVVGLDPTNSATLRASLPQQLAPLGVDSNAVIFRESRALLTTGRVATRVSSISNTIAQDVDVLVGGVLFSFPTGTCTIGAMVDYNGAASFLTGSHCTTTMFAPDGSVATQAFSNSRRVGAETRDVTGYLCGINQCRGSDAAIYGLDAGVL
jgi:hypothetical protein